MMSSIKKIQKTIEVRLKTPLTFVLNEDSAFEQIFGNVEEWIFEEGFFRFMLNPVNRRWLFWDSFHDSWEDTGHYAGEVKFVWDGKRLLTPKASPRKSDPGHDANAKMIVVNGSAQEYPVLANTLIGNERNSDITIEDTESKALILQHAGGYTFFAIGKKDEILVNDNAVPQEGVLLHDGDRIIIGNSKFDFVQISQCDENEIEKTDISPELTATTQATKALCHNCHAELEDGHKFCMFCGAKVIEKSITPTCSGCGFEIGENQKFCTNCGQKL